MTIGILTYGLDLNHEYPIISVLTEYAGYPRIEKSFIASELPRSNDLSIFFLIVQPVPAPPSIMAENTNKNKLGINNQKLMLLSLGNL